MQSHALSSNPERILVSLPASIFPALLSFLTKSLCPLLGEFIGGLREIRRRNLGIDCIQIEKFQNLSHCLFIFLNEIFVYYGEWRDSPFRKEFLNSCFSHRALSIQVVDGLERIGGTAIDRFGGDSGKSVPIPGLDSPPPRDCQTDLVAACHENMAMIWKCMFPDRGAVPFLFRAIGKVSECVEQLAEMWFMKRILQSKDFVRSTTQLP